MLKSLNQLQALRKILVAIRRRWLCRFSTIRIDPASSISLSSKFHSGMRDGIVIGPDSLIAFKTLLYTYDTISGRHKPVHVGSRCFIGGGSTITPGVTIGDGSIVGAGSVVFDDVPARSIVAGNPARIMRRDIVVGRYGRLAGADEMTRKLWRPD